jgi:acetolactate synthase-1/2/3 large subunit
MAREQLDATVVMLSNRAYAILGIEMARVRAAGIGERSAPMLSIDDPAIDTVALARALGVPAERAVDAEHATALLERSYATPGPMLIDVVL